MTRMRQAAVIVYNFFLGIIYEFSDGTLGYMTLIDNRDRDIRRLLKAIKSCCWGIFKSYDVSKAGIVSWNFKRQRIYEHVVVET